MNPLAIALSVVAYVACFLMVTDFLVFTRRTDASFRPPRWVWMTMLVVAPLTFLVFLLLLVGDRILGHLGTYAAGLARLWRDTPAL